MSQSGFFGDGGSGGSGILTINTIGPDGGGDFTLESGDGSVVFTPIANGLDLSVPSAPVFKGFQAYILNTTADNLTGTGSYVKVPYDSLFFDTTSGFNTGTAQFVVSETGVWDFNIAVYPYRLAGTNTYCIAALVIDGTTFYRMFEVDYENTQVLGELMLNASLLLNCNAGQTVEIQCAVGGGALNIGFGGTASFCRFSGYKVGTL